MVVRTDDVEEKQFFCIIFVSPQKGAVFDQFDSYTGSNEAKYVVADTVRPSIHPRIRNF
jgi:hypothetical protein